MSPLEQFNIYSLFYYPFLYTNSSQMMCLIVFLLFFYFSTLSTFIPSVFKQIMELVYLTSFELLWTNVGEKSKKLFPVIFFTFFFLICCNVLGMIPYSFTLTSQLILTFFLALTIFLAVNIIGIQKHKINFFNLFLPSGADLILAPLLIPIEIVSYIFRLISLPVRLFTNMMAGHTLLKVIAGFAWSLSQVGNILVIFHFIPLILLIVLIGLEFGVAIIQAYVFTILSCIYINDVLHLH